tara:strand:+ start:760 stop:1923 length:1164 start_codon:yes stop_codon:yes gene_type:complete
MKKLMLLFGLLFIFNLVDAADVDLVSYTPRPVVPGEEFTLVLEVQNSKVLGVNESLDVKVSVDDDNIFFLQGSGSETVTFFGPGEEEIEFTLLVADDVDLEEHELEVDVCVDGDCDGEEFIIKIKQDTSLVVDEISVPDSFLIGKTGDVVVTLKNEGDVDLEEIKVSLDLSGEDVPFSFEDSSEKVLDKLSSGDFEEFTFSLVVSKTAISGTYKVPLKIDYENTFGEEFSFENVVSLTVVADPELEISLGDDELIVGQNEELTLHIINKGLGEARFLQVKVLEGADYDILSSRDVYIGDVESDDFEVVNFRVFFYETEISFPVYIEYRDEENVLFSENVDLKPLVFTEEEAKAFGIIEDGNNVWIVVLVVLVVLFFWYRRRKKKKRR